MHLAGAACGGITTSNWQVREPHLIDFYWVKGAVEQILSECHADAEFAPLEPHEKDEDFIHYSLINNLLHPSYSFEVRLKDGARIGYFGLLHPQAVKQEDLAETTVVFELDMERLQKTAAGDSRIQPVRRTPTIRRDISLWVEDGVSWKDLSAEIRKTGGDILEDCRPFDLYKAKGESRKSLGFTLTFRHLEKTLDDETANKARDKIVSRLEEKFKAEQRK
jgi:phenylalanyl-tRNA synthetase beta chain